MFLCFLREVAAHIFFAKNIRNATMNCTKHTLPLWFLLFAAAEHFAIECKCCFADCIGEHSCVVVENAETEVELPRLKWRLLEKFCHLFKIFGLLHKKVCCCGETLCFEVLLPRERRAFLLPCAHTIGMVCLCDFVAVSATHANACKLGFKIPDGVSVSLGACPHVSK